MALTSWLFFTLSIHAGKENWNTQNMFIPL